MWRLKNSCSLAICQKLKTNFKKQKIVEKKLEKQEKKSILNNTTNFKLNMLIKGIWTSVMIKSRILCESYLMGSDVNVKPYGSKTIQVGWLWVELCREEIMA